MKKVQLFIAFILSLIPVVVMGACTFNPEQVGANYLEQKGPDNEDYEVYLVGTTLHGGNDRRFFENPVYAILSKQDCRIVNEIRLPAGGASQKMILNKPGGNIIIVMFWYNESNKIINSVAIHDYATLEAISHKQLPNKNISPDSTILVTAEGENVYSLFGSQEIYKLDAANLDVEGKFSVDDEYMSSMKLGEIKYLLLTDDKQIGKGKKKHWSNVIDQPLIDLWGINEKGEYRGFAFDLSGKVLKAGWTIGDLADLDLSYAPPFAPVWDPILVAANVANR